MGARGTSGTLGLCAAHCRPVVRQDVGVAHLAPVVPGVKGVDVTVWGHPLDCLLVRIVPMRAKGVDDTGPVLGVGQVGCRRRVWAKVWGSG